MRRVEVDVHDRLRRQRRPVPLVAGEALVDQRGELRVEVGRRGAIAQTHFNAEVIASWSTLQAATQWEDAPTTNNNGVYVYLRLPDGTAPA
ncbi:MAG: hypothetical protein AAFU38_09195, partial [Bacteroidota bacterium]